MLPRVNLRHEYLNILSNHFVFSREPENLEHAHVALSDLSKPLSLSTYEYAW